MTWSARRRCCSIISASTHPFAVWEDQLRTDKERYRALQIGADDFLSKQMPIRELLMRIQLLLTKYSDLSTEPERAGATEGDQAGAFQGRVEVFGTPALLQMCAQGRLSGLLTALAEDESGRAVTFGCPAVPVARLDFTTDLGDMAERQLVIEAVVEEEALKTDVFRTLDQVVTPPVLGGPHASSRARVFGLAQGKN